MKKSILAVAVLVSTSTFAQEKEYLPVAEDWAIGIDATPFLNYFGNFIGGGQNANAAPTWNFLTTNQTITGKYFVADDMAYRASLRLGFGSDKGSAMVLDRSVDPTLPSTWPDPAAEVENTWKAGSTSIGIGVGLEKRRGYNRLQGFYGAELGLNFSSNNHEYTYGNALTSSSATVDVNIDAADNFGSNVYAVGNDGQGNAISGRELSHKSGTGMYIGLRGFIGVEYFVLPKLAVGGEFGWGLVFASSGKSTTVYETEGLTATGTDTIVSEVTVEGTKTSGFGVDTDNVNTVFGPAASLRITFHF